MGVVPPILHVDLIIVGGGLVGGSLAAALADTGLRIALIEAVLPSGSDQPSFDDRSTALSPASRGLFESIGLWSELASEVAAIECIHVSDRGHAGRVLLSAREQGVPALGHVMPNRALGRVLADRLQSQGNLRSFAPARVSALTREPTGVSVRLDDGRTRIAGRLLVAAEGAESPIRKRLGIRLTQTDYGHCGLVANVRADRAAPGWAYERFTDSGPLALLPLPGDALSLVWSLPQDRVRKLLRAPAQRFLDDLEQAFGGRVGRFLEVGRRQAYPLRLQQAERVIDDRVVLVGNAARMLHPVAGQGFNLALRDVEALARILRRTDETGQDPGAGPILAEYARQRRQDVARVVSVTDTLVRVFSSRSPGLVLGRGAGLIAMELLPALKRRFARQAMGLWSD